MRRRRHSTHRRRADHGPAGRLFQERHVLEPAAEVRRQLHIPKTGRRLSRPAEDQQDAREYEPKWNQDREASAAHARLLQATASRRSKRRSSRRSSMCASSGAPGCAERQIQSLRSALISTGGTFLTFFVGRPDEKSPARTKCAQRDDRDDPVLKDDILPLRRYALALTRDADESDDLVQETLARADQKRRVRGPEARPAEWLSASLHNTHPSGRRRACRRSRAARGDLRRSPATAHPPPVQSGTLQRRRLSYP